MDAVHIRQMFAGMSEAAKELLGRQLGPEFSRAIIAVNKKLAAAELGVDKLAPAPELILRAFIMTNLDNIKVVILGQDPYITPGLAMGLSFSVPKGYKVPPSTRNIYKCLMYHKLMPREPDHGDLSSWAEQGVLLMNCALTTVLGKSNAHAECWAEYTDAILRELSNIPRSLIFIALGNYAIEKMRLIDKRRHIVLEWGHPSPLNSANQTDNPKNFMYCNVFARANDILTCRGLNPINWYPDWATYNATTASPAINNSNINNNIVVVDKNESAGMMTTPPQSDVQPDRTLWVFTDGGSSGNGGSKCRASWGYYITNGAKSVHDYGIVDAKNIPGQVYQASNNRGELTAILRALKYLNDNIGEYNFARIVLVSDSEYSIKCISEWAPKWLANPTKHKLEEKKNLDLIKPALEYVSALRAEHEFEFRHVRSHQAEPADTTTEDWFIWKSNDLVDKLCNKALGRV